jgi:hypothetical protein
MLEWIEKDGAFLVRRVGLHTSAEIHRRLFPHGAPALEAPIHIKASISKHMRKKHAGN